MSDQTTSLYADPRLTALEADVFGEEALRPVRPELEGEGDFLYGRLVAVEHGVDLKTGFAPVTVMTIEGVTGRLAYGTRPVAQGRRYGVAVLFASMRNRLEEFGILDPSYEPSGEMIGIRRGRDFKSTEGPSAGKMLTGWAVKMPDRPLSEPGEPVKPKRRAKGRKPAPATQEAPEPAQTPLPEPPPVDPAEEPF